MLEGICPRCELHYYGWALRFPRNQNCTICGAALDIIENGELIAKGYSPFDAEEYSIDLPAKATPPHNKIRKVGARGRHRRSKAI